MGNSALQVVSSESSLSSKVGSVACLLLCCTFPFLSKDGLRALKEICAGWLVSSPALDKWLTDWLTDCNQGTFLNNSLQQQKTIVNCMAINEDGVMATGGDNGSLWYASLPKPSSPNASTISPRRF